MILLFVWEIDLIMSAESRLHSGYTDFLDRIYPAFPIFERREMIKSIVIPCMNMVHTFVRYYIKSESYNKICFIGNHVGMRTMTMKIIEKVK